MHEAEERGKAAWDGDHLTIHPPLLGPLQDTKFINRFDLPPIAGIRTKVPLKPNNHSEFTRVCRKVRCPGCHSHPVSKFRDKVKGAHKLKSYDVLQKPPAGILAGGG